MKYYFSRHYSIINRIDLSSDESIKNWYDKTEIEYKYELKRFLGDDYKRKSILDLGCGIGGVLNFLKNSECTDYFGIDSSHEQVEVCKKYITNNIAEIDLFEFLNSNSKKYNIIFLLDVLEHIQKERIIELLELIKKSLSSNGKLIIRTPNMESFYAAYGRYIDFTHQIGFTSESLHQVLSEAEFDNIKFFNSSIGRKRIYLLKLVHKFFAILYRSRFSDIVTMNILSTAHKK